MQLRPVRRRRLLHDVDLARGVGPNGACLTLDLAQVANIHGIREIGVTFAPAAGADGRSAVYVDELSVR